MNTVHVEFDIPTNLIFQAGMNAEDAAGETRRILALFLYEHKRLSLGKACELGNMSYWEFADLNTQLGIPIAYGQEDLAADRNRLSHV